MINQNFINRIAARIVCEKLPLNNEGIMQAIKKDIDFCLDLIKQETTQSKIEFEKACKYTYKKLNN